MADGYNAQLRLRGPGGRVFVPLWLQSVSYDRTLQIYTARLKRGPVHHPIRFQERFLTFTALWPARDPGGRFEDAMEKIRWHWVANLSGDSTEPMRLSYVGADTPFIGFVDGYRRAYAWDDVLWTREFRMRLVSSATPGAILDQPRLNAPYVPHLGDVAEWGAAWYTSQELKQLGRVLLGGGEGSSDGDTSTDTPGRGPVV